MHNAGALTSEHESIRQHIPCQKESFFPAKCVEDEPKADNILMSFVVSCASRSIQVLQASTNRTLRVVSGTVAPAELTCPKIAPQVYVARYIPNTASAPLSERPRAPRPRPFHQLSFLLLKSLSKVRTCSACTNNVREMNVKL